MRKTLSILFSALILAAVGGGLAQIGLATEPYGGSGDRVPAVAVSTRSAAAQDSYTVARRFVGRVEARRESEIGFELGGQIDRVLVDEGEFVERGQVVARLDTRILRARRASLVAVRDGAQAELDLAELTRNRYKKALESNAVSTRDFDNADKGLLARRAALAGAQAAIDSIDVRIAKAELTAPFAALVARRRVDEGQVVAAGAPIFELLERTEPEVRIGVAGDSIDAVQLGWKTNLRVRDRDVAATVRAILPVRGNGTRSVDVIFTLHAEFDGIRRGDLATLSIERRNPERGYWLPLSALAPSARGLWAVYVARPLTSPAADATHVVERRELVVLHTEIDRVFARGTLEDGELWIDRGLQRIVPGQGVRLAAENSEEMAQ